MTKILNHINTYADLTAYDNDMEKDFPNISYIQGTDEVKWVKEDPGHIVCKYNVTSTSNATRLLNKDSGITYQIIDGVKQDAVQTSYTFDTLGEHIVEYKLDGTSIVNNAFQYCSNLTSVTIGSGVTSIGDSAFYSCSKLTSITIPNSVTSIGQQAFQSCGFTSITIPDSVTSIGYAVFNGCSSLTSITIPNSVTSIGELAFRGCSSLTSITIPSGVTSIGQQAFQNCSGLTSITIPSGVTSIGQQAFQSCSGLTSITIQATTPPTLANVNAFGNTNNCPIYVPTESLETYKNATNWSSLASRIQSISE